MFIAVVPFCLVQPSAKCVRVRLCMCVWMCAPMFERLNGVQTFLYVEYYLLITHLPIDEMHIKSNWWIKVSNKTVYKWVIQQNTKPFSMFHSMWHFGRFVFFLLSFSGSNWFISEVWTFCKSFVLRFNSSIKCWKSVEHFVVVVSVFVRTLFIKTCKLCTKMNNWFSIVHIWVGFYHPLIFATHFSSNFFFQSHFTQLNFKHTESNFIFTLHDSQLLRIDIL